jgi:hypothetical protein
MHADKKRKAIGEWSQERWSCTGASAWGVTFWWHRVYYGTDAI